MHIQTVANICKFLFQSISRSDFFPPIFPMAIPGVMKIQYTWAPRYWPVLTSWDCHCLVICPYHSYMSLPCLCKPVFSPTKGEELYPLHRIFVSFK